MRGGEEAGRKVVEQLTHIFGSRNVYVEVQRHREREEEWRNQAAIRIARALQLPVLATNGVRYAKAYDREILDLFTAIRNHTELDQRRPPARYKQRAPSPHGARDGGAVSRYARSNRKHHRTFVAARIRAERSGLRVSALSRARQRNHGELFAQTRRRRCCPALRAQERSRIARARKEAGGARARVDRESWVSQAIS